MIFTIDTVSDSIEDIQKIIDENKGAPFGALMGKSMAALKGKASGQEISKTIKKLL